MVTVKAVNEAIAKEFPDLHIEFIRGNGYQYFFSARRGTECEKLHTEPCGFCYLNQIPNVEYVLEHIRSSLEFYDEHGYHNI